jgi:hypothetical protein
MGGLVEWFEAVGAGAGGSPFPVEELEDATGPPYTVLSGRLEA